MAIDATLVTPIRPVRYGAPCSSTHEAAARISSEPTPRPRTRVATRVLKL